MNTIYCCDSIRFKHFVEEYFTFYTNDSNFELLDEYNHKWNLSQEEDYKYTIQYFNSTKWHSECAFNHKNNYILNFWEEVDKGTYGSVNTKFLLCDVCGNILDTLFLEEVATRETPAFDKFSEYYANKNGFAWILYDGIEETNYRELLCTKTSFIIKGGKIIQKGTKQYRKPNDIVW